MQQAHATLGSLLARLETTENGATSFIPSAQHVSAKQSFRTAHDILLIVLQVQDTVFKVDGLTEKLNICRRDFIDIWKQDDGKDA